MFRPALFKIALSPCVALLVLVELPLAATTYQMVSDRDLTDQASAVAVVRVVGAEPGPAGRGPTTDYLVEVDRVLKGSLPGSTVVVRVVGGVGADGIGLKIWGAPAFAEGERTLLFLVPGSDGAYRILHLMLGAFHERPTLDGKRVALRNLSEAHAIGDPGPDLFRDFDAFADWLLDRGLGIERPANYVLPQGTAVARNGFEKYVFLTDNVGIPNRWFRFDEGRPVEWNVFGGGQPGLSLDDTIGAFQVGINTWSTAGGVDIRYRYVGTTDANGGFARHDGVNTILFDDPYRDTVAEVPGSYSCPGGGVIAIGGPWYFVATRAFRALTVHESIEADIITNDGTECFFRNNRSGAEEVFTHELGHSLGLGHTPDADAIMFATAHNDGRGAALKQDDLNGIAALYSFSGPLPTKTPAAPANLAARASASNRVVLTWRDKSNNEEGFDVEARIGTTGDFFDIGTVPANSKSVTELGVDPGGTYQFRMRAYNRKGLSPYTKTVTIKMPR
jgi:hypothetical protein